MAVFPLVEKLRTRFPVLRRLGAAGPMLMVLPFWPPLGGFLLLATLTRLGPWLRDHGEVGMVVFFLLTGFLMGVSFVPTYSVAILAGWAFGFAVGWPLAMATITVSSLVSYAIARWAARDRVLEIIRERPTWNALREALLGQDRLRTILVVTLLRVPPASPFAIANFVLAAARVALPDYTLGTLLGIAPRTALAVWLAAGLEHLRFKDVGDRWTMAVSIGATVVACVALGVLAQRALRGMTAARGSAPVP
ncbi:MAG: hypothetical protein RLZZ15_599 [Verrucomicrobiota bacterium]|jgi:uncharacterized membrane protein YdjX (TVP38/TMEM64 family)